MSDTLATNLANEARIEELHMYEHERRMRELLRAVLEARTALDIAERPYLYRDYDGKTVAVRDAQRADDMEANEALMGFRTYLQHCEERLAEARIERDHAERLYKIILGELRACGDRT